MLTSKNRARARKKPLITWSSTTASILISFTLITGSFILITPTLIASALAQEGNFSEFPEFDEEEFSPQSEEDLISSLSSFMTEVNGTYMNPNIGFQINLPPGWKGIEFNYEITAVFAVPVDETSLGLLGEGGLGEEDDDVQAPAAFMTIMGIDQEGFSWFESISQLSALGGGAADGGGGEGGEQAGSIGGGQEEGVGATSLPQEGNSDALGITTTTPSGISAVSCTLSPPSFVTINGINAEERTGECIDAAGGGSNAKTKSYTFATQDNSLIVVGFYGNSTSVYDQNLPLFEESVRTISISRPADIATSEIYNRYTELLEMQQQQQQQLSNQTGGGM